VNRKCVFVGDMHVGSLVGLWATASYEDGTRLPKNPAQSYLLAQWTEFWSRMALKGYDTVFLLGDLCDGNNRKEFGRNLTSVELTAQVDVAERLLKYHVADRKVISVEGSRYHQSIDSSLDQRVAERLAKYADVTHVGSMAVGELEGTGRHSPEPAIHCNRSPLASPE